MMDNIRFVGWLINRLCFKHGYNNKNPIIIGLQNIIQQYKSPIEINIMDKDLDLILAKYYLDFYLDNSPDMNIGYSEEQRNALRKMARCLTYDIINQNIPKETSLTIRN